MVSKVLMENLKTTSDEDLIDEAKSLHQRVFTIGCFDAYDVVSLEFMLLELKERGYAFSEALEVFKPEESCNV